MCFILLDKYFFPFEPVIGELRRGKFSELVEGASLFVASQRQLDGGVVARQQVGELLREWLQLFGRNVQHPRRPLHDPQPPTDDVLGCVEGVDVVVTTLQQLVCGIEDESVAGDTSVDGRRLQGRQTQGRKGEGVLRGVDVVPQLVGILQVVHADDGAGTPRVYDLRRVIP